MKSLKADINFWLMSFEPVLPCGWEALFEVRNGMRAPCMCMPEGMTEVGTGPEWITCTPLETGAAVDTSTWGFPYWYADWLVCCRSCPGWWCCGPGGCCGSDCEGVWCWRSKTVSPEGLASPGDVPGDDSRGMSAALPLLLLPSSSAIGLPLLLLK